MFLRFYRGCHASRKDVPLCFESYCYLFGSWDSGTPHFLAATMIPKTRSSDTVQRQDRPCAILQTLTATSSKLRKSAQKSASCMEFVGYGLSRIHLSYHIASWLSFNGLSVELEIIFPAWSGTKYANICILTLTVRLRSFTPLVAINWDGGPNPQKILPTFVFTSDSSGMRNPKSLGGFRPTLAIDLEALGYTYCTYRGPMAHLDSEKMVLFASAQCLAKWHSWKPHIVRFFKLSSTFCTAGAKASKAKPLR